MSTATTILTGIKPTGQPHLGNYLGAILPALKIGKNYERRLFFVADGHALVSCQTGEIKQMSYEVAAAWIASGLDPKKDLLYRQSDVPEIFEMAWILSCFTPKGFMNRSHAYKTVIQNNQDKRGSSKLPSEVKDVDQGVSMGLYSYPVLMAADILLFAAKAVPVGQDQKQHLEFTRDIAQKFNHSVKKDVLTPPECVSQEGSYILGLDGQKMSKSYNNHIPLFASEKKLQKLINKIKTDSLSPGASKPFEGTIIASIYKCFATQQEIQSFKLKLEKGLSWGEAKQNLFEKVNTQVAPIREKYEFYMSNLDALEKLLQEGGFKARALAKFHLSEVKKHLGLSCPVFDEKRL